MANKKPKGKKKETEPRAYEFTVTTVGHGHTPQEAWTASCEYIIGEFDDFANTRNLPDFKILPKGY